MSLSAEAVTKILEARFDWYSARAVLRQAAERIGASSPFVQQTRESLQKMKELLLAEAKAEEAEKSTATPPGS